MIYKLGKAYTLFGNAYPSAKGHKSTILEFNILIICLYIMTPITNQFFGSRGPKNFSSVKWGQDHRVFVRNWGKHTSHPCMESCH